jgi:hypothetical protein
LPTNRATLLWKYLWLKKRIVNLYRILMTSTRCVQKSNFRSSGYKDMLNFASVISTANISVS